MLILNHFSKNDLDILRIIKLIGPIQQSMHDSTQEFSKLQEELTKNFNVILQQQQQGSLSSCGCFDALDMGWITGAQKKATGMI